MTQGIDRIWQIEAKTQETKQLIRDIKSIPAVGSPPKRRFESYWKAFGGKLPSGTLASVEALNPAHTMHGSVTSWKPPRRGSYGITRDATRIEIQEIRHENARLKTLVAELSLQCTCSKKQQSRSPE